MATIGTTNFLSQYQRPPSSQFDWMGLGPNLFGENKQGSQDTVSAVGQGAAQGAMGGAALGPWGALAGGVIGAGGAAINASDEASNKQVEDQEKQNELRMLYEKFLQSKRIADEDRARSGMDMFLNIGNIARKEYKGNVRDAALKAAGVI